MTMTEKRSATLDRNKRLGVGRENGRKVYHTMGGSSGSSSGFRGDTEIVIDDDTHTNNADKTTNDGTLELSQLHRFAISGNKKKLQEAINSGPQDVDEADSMGRTPLIYSVLVEQMECVLALLKAGADPDIPDSDGRTALHWASYQGNHKLVKILITKCKQKTACDKEGRTPLHLSISHDNIKVMQVILKYLSVDEVDKVDNKLMTALCWAVFYERIEHTKLLLRHGASTTICDNDGRSLLHWTSQNQTPTLIRILLDAGCDTINFSDKEGRTPLHMAVGHGSVTIVEFLLTLPNIALDQRDGIKRTPLHWAAVLGQRKIVELLLKHGANYSISDNNGAKALHYAAQNNNYEVVIAMLDQEQKIVDEPDDEMRTALMWASVTGSEEVMKALLERKCTDINAVDIHKQTALHMSCQAGHLNCVNLLIASGADVNINDKEQHIPLFYACATGHVEIVSELLKNDSTLNLHQKDLEGRTSLHFAAMVDRRDIVKILIEHQLDPTAKDNAGCTPLHIAAYGGFVHCMGVLLENGASVDMQDNDGQTALHMACRSGALDAVKLLVSRYNANVNILDKSETQLTCLDYTLLEDHQDVSFFLIENRGYTGAALRDGAAIKIQAIYRGFYFRKLFEKQKALFVKHEKNRKREVTPTNLSSSSETSSVMLNPQYQELQQHQYNQHHHYQQYETAQASPGTSVVSKEPRSPTSVHHIEIPRRQRTKSINSVVSGASQVSSRSSAPNPEKPKSSDVRQGPKFVEGSNTNPFSLNRVSRVFNPYSDTKLYVSTPTKAKSTIGVFDYSPREKPMKRSSVGETTRVRKHSSRSSVGPGEVFFNPLNSKSSGDRNNLYSGSYSRHFNNDSHIANNQQYNQTSYNMQSSNMSDSSESSTLFKAKSSHYPLPQISLSNAPNSDETSSSQSIPPVLHPEPKHLFIPTPPSKPPTNATRGYASTLIHNDPDNKPWNVFRRDQKRINIIRQKTEAAVKIQAIYRGYRVRKYTRYIDRAGRFLMTEDSVTDESTVTVIAEGTKGGDSETDSYDTTLSTPDELQEEIPDEETLQEVAALVIQAGWRQYVKNKLIREAQRSKDDISQENVYLDGATETNDSQVYLPKNPHDQSELDFDHEDIEMDQNERSTKRRDSKKTRIKNLAGVHKVGPLNPTPQSKPSEGNKKKLVSSQSFPLMQNIYRESVRKKRTKRFSIKKRLLSRSHANQQQQQHQNETTLSSANVTLKKKEIQAVKSGKAKVLIRTKRVDKD